MYFLKRKSPNVKYEKKEQSDLMENIRSYICTLLYLPYPPYIILFLMWPKYAFIQLSYLFRVDQLESSFKGKSSAQLLTNLKNSELCFKLKEKPLSDRCHK